MRISKGFLVLVVVSFLFGMAANVLAGPQGKGPPTPTSWPNNKGEICLHVYVVDEDEGDCVYGSEIKMYVSKMGDGHYLVIGRNTEPDDVSPFIGAAEFVEVEGVEKVKIHATNSTREVDGPGMRGNIAVLFLDPSTLTGEVYSIELRNDIPGGAYGVHPDEGVGYLVPCGELVPDPPPCPSLQ